MVSGAEGLLLYDRWQGLRDYCFASDGAYSSTHSFPHATANATADTASDGPSAKASAATSATPHGSACTRWTCRSIQLRCWTVFFMGWSQAAVVLQDSPRVWTAHATAGTS